LKRKKSDYLFFFLYFVIYLYFFFTGVRTGRFSEAFLFSSWLVMLYFFFIVISEKVIRRVLNTTEVMRICRNALFVEHGSRPRRLSTST